MTQKKSLTSRLVAPALVVGSLGLAACSQEPPVGASVQSTASGYTVTPLIPQEGGLVRPGRSINIRHSGSCMQTSFRGNEYRFCQGTQPYNTVVSAARVGGISPANPDLRAEELRAFERSLAPYRVNQGGSGNGGGSTGGNSGGGNSGGGNCGGDCGGGR
ncbi:MAG: hypothetical protein LAT82_01700 [Nanoarchaeota archaeon]|nr:hypothetical protein [Nanoarchaeota archaeon]